MPVLLEHATRWPQRPTAPARAPEVVALMAKDRGGRTKEQEKTARAEVEAMRREGEKRRRR